MLKNSFRSKKPVLGLKSQEKPDVRCKKQKNIDRRGLFKYTRKNLSSSKKKEKKSQEKNLRESEVKCCNFRHFCKYIGLNCDFLGIKMLKNKFLGLKMLKIRSNF